MTAAADLEPYRFSLEEYHRLIEAGGLDEDARVELLDGLLVAMSPKSPAHEKTLALLVRWLARQLPDGYELRPASPLTLADSSEPEPDVAVIAPGTREPYHPATAALVIEIAASSLHRDLTIKAPKYAAAGVPVYLIVDLEARRVIEHTAPTASGYRSVREVDALDPRLPDVGALDARAALAAVAGA